MAEVNIVTKYTKIDADLVLAVVLSLVFETVLWYIAATIAFKKKKF